MGYAKEKSPNEINMQKPETVREALQQHKLQRNIEEIRLLTEALAEEKRRVTSYKQALEQNQTCEREVWNKALDEISKTLTPDMFSDDGHDSFLIVKRELKKLRK